MLSSCTESGALVPLFGRPLTRELAYYALWRSSAHKRTVSLFLKWLVWVNYQ